MKLKLNEIYNVLMVCAVAWGDYNRRNVARGLVIYSCK